MTGSSKFIFSAALASTVLPMLDQTPADAAVLAQFTFQSLNNPTNTTAPMVTVNDLTFSFIAETPSGTGIGVHTSTPLGAGNSPFWSAPLGNGSNRALSSTVWRVGDYFQFQVPTSSFEDILISFDQISSATGPRNWQLAYSVDGSSFTPASGYSVSTGSWSSATTSPGGTYAFDLSAVTALNNLSLAYFRLEITGTQPAGTGTTAFPITGTTRIDNFTVEGSPIPEPASLGLITAAASLLLRRRKA